MRNNIFGEFTSAHDAVNDAWRYASGEADKENLVRSLRRQIEQEEQLFLETEDMAHFFNVAKLREQLLIAEGGEQ